MPTYVYRCDRCGYTLEKFQKMTDEPLTICPKCSGHLSRLITGGAGMIFKGAGFYVNDYKSSNAPSTASVDSKSVANSLADVKDKS